VAPSQSPSQLLSAEAMVMEPDHFERFVQRAALAMGPLAHSLCLRIALHTDDLSLAHALLAESIPDPAQRQAFLAQAPAPSSSRLAAPAWFGWRSLLESDACACRAVQDCAVFVWPAAVLRPILARCAAADLQAFAALLQQDEADGAALSAERLVAWARAEA